MRFRFAIFMLFIGNCSLYAQLGNETSDEEEKDRIAIGDNAMNAQRESAWSLSSSNFDWKAPMQVNGRWEAVSLPSRNVNISIPSTSSRQRSGYTQSQIKAYKRAKRVQEHNAWVERRNAEIEAANEAARRRAEERKRRIEEENRRDRERGLMEYYARTAGFHQANAERDHWMATEGVRHLREDYHATDLADIPQGQFTPKIEGMSGKELANLLNTNDDNNTIEGDITVTFVENNESRDNKRGVAINKDNSFIDLFDDGGRNQTEVFRWNEALHSDKPLITPSSNWKAVQGYTKTLLIEKGQLNLNKFNITSLPNMGCVTLIGDSILLLDNDSLPFLQWNVESNISEVVVCGARTFGKQDYKIVEIEDDGLKVICEFESDEFNIYPETDNTLLICAKIFDMNIVTRINVKEMKYDELLRTTSSIRKVVSNRTAVFALLTDRIIEISNYPTLFYYSPNCINDICMCPDGLLLATDDTIVLLKSANDTFSFDKSGASRLWCDGADIYVIDTEGNLIRFSKNQ